MKKRATALTILLFLACILAGAFNTALAGSGVIRVPTDYLTIQEAVDAANEGDTVFVYNGTYYEHVVVNKSLSLIGEDRSSTIIDGNGTGVVVKVTADNVRIRGFTIRNGGPSAYDCSVLFWYSSNITFVGNIVTDNKAGGIYLADSSNNTVSLNTIKDNLYSAIRMEWVSYTVVTKNVMTNNSVGVTMYRCYDNLFEGNLMSNAMNTWTNNTCGIFMFPAHRNVFRRNTIAHNEVGVAIFFSHLNVFYHNNFMDNEEQVRFFGPCENTTWDDGYPSGGNYWSDYAGNDEYKGLDQDILGSDRIGDSPYVIDGTNQDNYPLMSPYMLEDLNYDSKVDIRDIAAAAIAFGSYPGHSRWNYLADVNLDNKIDIRDIASIARNFGWAA